MGAWHWSAALEHFLVYSTLPHLTPFSLFHFNCIICYLYVVTWVTTCLLIVDISFFNLLRLVQKFFLLILFCYRLFWCSWVYIVSLYMYVSLFAILGLKCWKSKLASHFYQHMLPSTPCGVISLITKVHSWTWPINFFTYTDEFCRTSIFLSFTALSIWCTNGSTPSGSHVLTSWGWIPSPSVIATILSLGKRWVSLINSVHIFVVIRVPSKCNLGICSTKLAQTHDDRFLDGDISSWPWFSSVWRFS